MRRAHLPRRHVPALVAPLCCCAASAAATAAIWLAAEPSSTASAIVALCTFLAILAGDFAAGVVADEADWTDLWQAASRLTLIGSALGLAVAAAVTAELSRTLTTMALGAAFVTAIRASTAEYESFAARVLADRGAPHAADAIARFGASSRAWSLALAIDAAILAFVLPRVQLDWFLGFDWILAVFFGLFALPMVIALSVAEHDARMRGRGGRRRDPRQLKLELFPEEPAQRSSPETGTPKTR